ncbi:threonine/serine dehydratase [Tahibacter amnicola]|uniref:Threonine/serine dehydratase n=1 Tax=Tahibacter amnicola TaxID=2976241 RepID=A0ABY6BGP4_9GAMM|nr:threonine/serine dehydratase [Tahibacter amnicola]UXI69188.1 threonine/serine dehydratase [Tahibacter amnicola]
MAPALFPSRSDIEAASERIRRHVRRTPVIQPGAGSFGHAGALWLKLECLQHAGSFKPRGAFNRLLSQLDIPAAGVIAASGGNHGAAVAYAARALGIPAEIFVPDIVAPAKLERLRQFGAQVVVGGREYADALQASQNRQAQTGALAIHAYDDFDVVAGQGTLGRELEEQVPDLDTILVAVGGGGLIGGMAAWYRGRARLIGVEPRTSCALHDALAAGKPVDVTVSGVAADSLGARRAGTIALAAAQGAVERVVLVDDNAIVDAQRKLWTELRIFAEPGGAAALSALLSGAYRPQPGENVGVIVCGANGVPPT